LRLLVWGGWMSEHRCREGATRRNFNMLVTTDEESKSHFRSPTKSTIRHKIITDLQPAICN
jgi:hypothetical protein